MKKKEFHKKNKTYKTKQNSDDKLRVGNNKPDINTSHNDPKWYSKYPALLRDAGKLSFNNPVGLPVSNLINNNPDYKVAQAIVVPGIMRLDYMPTVGVSTIQSSDVNTAARIIYSYVRHANSGSRNYESPDLMMYLLAASGLYSYYAFMVRVYGLTRIYSLTNRYVPKALLKSMGVDDELFNKLADFRYYINYFATKANTFATPKQFAFYDRAATLPLHIYKDASDTKSQFYYFNPVGFYKFEGTAEETGTSLTVTGKQGPTWDLETFIATGDLLLNAMLSNEDAGLMSGDIIKAFGRGNLRELSSISEDYSTIPVYDKYMLTQIHNTRVGNAPLNDSFKVTQSNGIITCQPQLAIGSYYQSTDTEELTTARCRMDAALIPLIDFGWEDPTPEDVMEASRLQFTLKDEVVTANGGQNFAKVESCGTEIVTSVDIFAFEGTSGDVDSIAKIADAYTPTELSQFNISLIYKSVFDWAPITYKFFEPNSDSLSVFPVGEIFNYTLLDHSTISKLHGCALLSLYEIPNMGSLV